MQREVRDYALAQVHAHGEGGWEVHEIDNIMGRQGCNDVWSKVNESNRVPLEQRRIEGGVVWIFKQGERCGIK